MATPALHGTNDGAVPIKEAAAILGVSTDTIRRRLKDGRLHGEFVDGMWMVELPHTSPPAGGDGVLPARLVVELLQRELDRREAEVDRLMGVIESSRRPWYRRIFS